VILNLCMIAGALWLAPHLQVPITALGWAILVGGILQLLFQLPALRGLDLLTLPKWGWSHPDVRKVVKLMVPTLFGSSIAQINLLFDTVIAALLYTGSQTWLSQADRFLELPLGVFGIALGTVILPTLSRHHVNTDHEGFSKALDWGLRTTLLIALPAMLGLMLLSQPLVATLFQHDQFTAFDTRMAAMSVFGLSFGLPAFALVKILLPAFYARQDTRTPVRAGVASLVANMVLNVAFLAVLYVLWVPASEQGSVMHGLASTPGLHLAIGLASAAGELHQSGPALALAAQVRRVRASARLDASSDSPGSGLRGDGGGDRRSPVLDPGLHCDRQMAAHRLPRPAGWRRRCGVSGGAVGPGLPPARSARALRPGHAGYTSEIRLIRRSTGKSPAWPDLI
jgi:peptidoglycan biosynthesis protein MviN/MurJ (putative lipid II flippase)